MISKKAHIKDWRLYVILDRAYASDGKIMNILRVALKGGADAVQLRDKSGSFESTVKIARKMRHLCSRRGVPLIVNDRADVAISSNADGLHLGKGDMDISCARKLMGRRLIGFSAGTLKDALEAKRKGADYLGAGPVFKTPVKRRKAVLKMKIFGKISRVGLPVMAIGGIDARRAKRLIGKGIRSIAVIRAVMCARDPFRSTRQLKEIVCS